MPGMALERQWSFQDTVNCDQLSSAKLQATIINLKIFWVSRSVLLKFNQNKLDAIFLRMMLSEKIDIVAAS